MVLVLLFGAFVQAATGLFANDEIFNTGPLVGYVGKDFSLALTSVHRRMFYVLLAAIALHVLAVVAHKIFKGENLVVAMITGRKADASDDEAIKSSRLWLAAPLAAGLVALLYWIIATAPRAALDNEF
jgi:cytochrome b